MQEKNMRGITLIALVITIVVLIILAAVSINAILGENGLITKAQQAKHTYGNSVTAEENAMDKFLNDIDKAIAGTESSAKVVKKAPMEYYGKTITNYTGYGKEASNYNWQIYYSDGNNIFITTTDYILTADCPNGRGVNVPTTHTTYQVSWGNIVKDYNGSADITNEKITPWLSYLSKGEDINNNMKATAYLLDTSMWNTNFKGTKADYAIGAPTLDMFVASYKDTHPDKYIEFQPGELGYKVKWSNSNTYESSIGNVPQNDFNKIYIKGDTDRAYCQWLASSAESADNLMTLINDGNVRECSYYCEGLGVRPIVCLSSDVVLEKDGVGYKII